MFHGKYTPFTDILHSASGALNELLGKNGGIKTGYQVSQIKK